MQFDERSRRFGRTVGTFGIALLALGAVVAPAPAQDEQAPAGTTQAETLPSPAEIHADYIKALGGEDAIRAHKSSLAKGTFKMPAAGIEGTLTIYSVAPDTMMVITTLPGMGEIRQGYTGEYAWQDNPMTGPSLMEDAQANMMASEADFYSELSVIEEAKESKTLGIEDFKGQKAYAVEVTTPWDMTQKRYYSVETGLLLGITGKQDTEMGPIEMTTTFEDYKEFGGVKSPTKSTVSVMGQSQIIEIQSVEYDAVNPAEVEVPQSIKTLIEQRQAEKAKGEGDDASGDDTEGEEGSDTEGDGGNGG